MLKAVKDSLAGIRGHYVGEYTTVTGNVLIVSTEFVPIISGDDIVEGGVCLFEDISARAQAETEIRELNRELENKVAERTARLEATNLELESFSYSVSHDLRAPLRSIDGFSQALLEDYEEDLDDTGKDYLHRVRNASQRMGQLIDDLLELSRLTQGDVHRGEIDLSALALEIAAGLRDKSPDRQVDVSVEEGIIADGDERLIRVMMENLLGNAWKYSAGEELAKIEIGVVQQDGQDAFYVRDNGVGFDMAYSDRLFGVFQRLHDGSEFEGTGIGLATVQRIINRHGGRIWAEGVVGEGATFFFTLS